MFDSILGYVTVTFQRSDAVYVFNEIAESNIPYRKLKTEDGTLSMNIPLYKLKVMKKIFYAKGITEYSFIRKGIPGIIRRYRKRWGILVGALIFALTVYMSGNVIWCVRVEGNYTVPDKEIISELDKLGCGVGKRIDAIDFDVMCNEYLIYNKNLSWIFVNMNGTVANVEVKEFTEGKTDSSDMIYNLTASEDGHIVSLSSTEGKPVVKINDTVKKGDLLVSGISVIREKEIDLESATGKIFATVQRSFDVNVPVNYNKTVKTGNKSIDKGLRIFNFNLNLFRNSRNQYEFYDTIYSESDIYMFGAPLPLTLTKRTDSEYVTKNVVLSEKEAEEIAVSEYKKALAKTVGDDRLVSKTVTSEFDGKKYHISCRMYCIADIAKPTELKIKDQ